MSEDSIAGDIKNDLLSLTLSYEELKTQNNTLKVENDKLRQHISHLGDKIIDLQKHSTNNPQESSCADKDNLQQLQTLDIQKFISCEIESKFMLIAEDLKFMKLKINKLDMNNVNMTQKITHTEKVIQKTIWKHIQTKSHVNKIKPVTPKQKPH